MGHTLEEWTAKIASLIRDDAGRDLGSLDIVTVGLAPALAEHGEASPRLVVEDVDASGTSYIDTPDGWVSESEILSVEYPIGRNPPVYVCRSRWTLVRSTADPTVTQILFVGTVPSSAVRVTYVGGWPVPTDDATDDLLSARSFEAVSALAASYCCVALAALAARGRDGGMSTDLSEGRARAENLQAAAGVLREVYKGQSASGSVLL